MEHFTIYCTEEQTKKALELGAPIKINSHPPFNGENFMWLSPPDDAIVWNNSTNCLIPTAEQMIGWLEEQGIDITIYNYQNISFAFELNCVSNGKRYFNRKEATIAAIDTVLEYLLNNVKQ